MAWVLILMVYFLGLLYFAAHTRKIASRAMFRFAWFFFSLIPIVHAVFTILRFDESVPYLFVERMDAWSNGACSFLIGLSMLCLLGATVPRSAGGASSEGPGPSGP